MISVKLRTKFSEFKTATLSDSNYHTPVLLFESVEGMVVDPDGVYVDVTFGSGAHSQLILDKLSAKGHLYSFDQDGDAKKNLIEDPRFTFVESNFRYMKRFMKYYGVESVSGVLADLGVSSFQLDTVGRGFSYRFEDALDMRMNTANPLTAAHVINTYSFEMLVNIFSQYGNVRNSKSLAKSIILRRNDVPFNDVQDFVDHLIQHRIGTVPKYLATVFQALRIEVNDEVGALRELLHACKDLLRQNGRLAAISYHSLEDRMVKRMIKSGSVTGKSEEDEKGRVKSYFRQVHSKVILPTEDEMERNSRAKSAKLRIAERL